MEEKDVNSIAGAVSRELAKLNTEKPEPKGKEEGIVETFNCPECGGKVNTGIPFCSNCGCPLEWSE